MSQHARGAVTPGIARPHAAPGLAGPGRPGPVTNHTGVLPDLGPAAPASPAAGARRGPDRLRHAVDAGEDPLPPCAPP
ncbi:hypothetical protein [Streptomyces sp. NRRL S-31]|uniref:hypothetical protein n=1 Tax=Streptomyces sp. NRRL S-31 TaxID=1463898 RepID=UPI0004CABBF5|nr:hypothetical protein [Streptomyces sp. NRRL S-31]